MNPILSGDPSYSINPGTTCAVLTPRFKA
jgi:hypothetical protein